MKEKITLEEFRRIKEELAKNLKESNEQLQGHEDDEALRKDYENKYTVIQNKLSNYDLSDIPSDEWGGIEFFGDVDNVVDLSNTHANLDFEIIRVPFVNAKGCNVLRLREDYKLLDPNNFDPSVVEAHPDLFLRELSHPEVRESILKGNTTIEELSSLTDEEIELLKTKNIETTLEAHEQKFVDFIGLDRAVEIFKYSKEVYDYIKDICAGEQNIVAYFNYSKRDEFFEELKTCDLNEIRKITNDRFKEVLARGTTTPLSPESYVPAFVSENAEFFMLDESIPKHIREEYYNRNLSIDDVLDNIDYFENIPFAYFMYYNTSAKRIFEHLYYEIGADKTYLIAKQYPDLLKYIDAGFNDDFVNHLDNNPIVINEEDNVGEKFNEYAHRYLSTKNALSNADQLLLYEKDYHGLAPETTLVIDFFGLDNIKRFEKEIGFFSHNNNTYNSNGLPMLEALAGFLHSHSTEEFKVPRIDYNKGSLTYDEFLETIANSLEMMRGSNVFQDFENYDWIEGSFRERFSSIFMGRDAPLEFKNRYYKNTIDPEFINENPTIVPYLMDKNLSRVVRTEMKLRLSSFRTLNGNTSFKDIDFIEQYISRYGNEKFLNLCTKYGVLLKGLVVNNLNNEIDNEEELNKSIMKAIHDKIIESHLEYIHLKNDEEFVKQNPDLFVDFSSLENASEEEKIALENKFYNRDMNFSDIKKYPGLVELLKNKNLGIAFGNKPSTGAYLGSLGQIMLPGLGMVADRGDLDLLAIVNAEEFLDLCRTYGDLIHRAATFLSVKYQFGKDRPSIEEVRANIKEYIVNYIIQGHKEYNEETAPDFLRKEHPELFLNEDAPEELKKYFYHENYNYALDFYILASHKEWIPYLQGKSIRTALIKGMGRKEQLNLFFNLFGEEKALRIGMAKPETVNTMLDLNKISIMKLWYDKTGCKFIPDSVVMVNMDINEADKFLNAGVFWSELNRIKPFSKDQETRDAMFKLAYSFGTFDQDIGGYKKLLALLNAAPRTLDKDRDYIIDRLDHEVDQYSQRGAFFKNKIRRKLDDSIEYIYPEMTPEEKEEAYNKTLEYAKSNQFDDTINTDLLVRLLETLKKEKVDIDFSRPIFSQLYRKYVYDEESEKNKRVKEDKKDDNFHRRKHEDGTLVLTLDEQKYPRSAALVREALSKFRELNLLTPDMAHQLFGGFDMKYDPDFREFLLKYLPRIMKDTEKSKLLSSVQKRFDEIKAVNINRTLTWDLAASYVQTNQYDDIELGNERVADISSIAGYNQKAFATLQRIYNYGKQRVFSSIPRIDKRTSKYQYEMLRLDDPMAMAIGTLTDCCQELGNVAEGCMEHSMVDKNGRVFVVRDSLGNIISQSWVWRNKDVLCFDNIEIPKKAFERSEAKDPSNGRKRLTEDVYEIYKQAAHDLIEEDEKAYKKLLDEGRITEEQYEGLRLGKVTVGLGYNDIRETLEEKAPVDKGQISRPLPYYAPVDLNRSLYTNDSNTQHILEERENRPKVNGPTLTLHNDELVAYENDTFDASRLLTLEKLEVATKGTIGNKTSISEYADKDHLVSEIADNYGLNRNTTRISMGPNYAIIYDEDDKKVRIADIFYNMNIGENSNEMNIENTVLLQLRLALEQIKGSKDLEVMNLSDAQKEVLAKVTMLNEEIDRERGL